MVSPAHTHRKYIRTQDYIIIVKTTNYYVWRAMVAGDARTLGYIVGFDVRGLHATPAKRQGAGKQEFNPEESSVAASGGRAGGQDNKI